MIYLHTILLIIQLLALFKMNNLKNEIDIRLEVRKEYEKQKRASILHLSAEDAMELLSEVLELPRGYYYMVNPKDLLEVTIYNSELNGLHKVQTYILNSYKPKELISFGIEVNRRFK